jgi:hypothetical protein
VQAATHLKITWCADGMRWLDGCSKISVWNGCFPTTLEGRWMGDYLEFFGVVLGLILMFCMFSYYIIHVDT